MVKKFLIFLALLAAFTLWQIPYSQLLQDQFSKIKPELAKQGVFLDFGELRALFPVGIGFQGLNGMLKLGPTPIPFQADSGEFKLGILSLFRARADLKGEFKFYGGTLRSAFNQSLRGARDTSWDLELTDLALDKHPFLEFYGVGGKVSGTFNLRPSALPAEPVPQGDFTINIREGSLKSGQTIGVVKLPPLNNLSLEAVAELRERRLGTKKFELKSSLLDGSGRGECQFESGGGLGLCNGSFELNLTTEGLQSVGPYLALAAGLPVENPARRWKIEVAKDSRNQFTSRVTPLP